MKKSVFFNPFYLFSISWAIVFAGYLFSFFTKYPSYTTADIFLFLIIIISSFIFGKIHAKTKITKPSLTTIDKLKLDKSTRILFFITLIFVFVGLAINKHFPIYRVLVLGDSSAYGDFQIPHFNTIYIALFIILSIESSIGLFYGNKKRRKVYFFYLVYTYIYFLLLYSRGMIIYLACGTAIVWLSKWKKSLKNVLLLLFFIFVAAVGFNILGNIRNGSSWNDSTILKNLVSWNKKYDSIDFLSHFISYMETPIGNLVFQVSQPINSFRQLLNSLLPDFIANRTMSTNASLSIAPPLVNPAITASTAFSKAAWSYGYFGVLLSFVEIMLSFFVLPKLVRTNLSKFLISVNLGMIAVLTPFDNLLLLWGFSFSLLVIIFIDLIYRLNTSQIPTRNLYTYYYK